jgi:predicted nucleotidyltransferase
VIDYQKLRRQVQAHPYPLVFVTISGAHLYGFPSADSDFDLRGIYRLPLEQIVSLDIGKETVEQNGVYDGLEIDLVTHDVKKILRDDAQSQRLCVGAVDVTTRGVDDA